MTQKLRVHETVLFSVYLSRPSAEDEHVKAGNKNWNKETKKKETEKQTNTQTINKQTYKQQTINKQTHKQTKNLKQTNTQTKTISLPAVSVFHLNHKKSILFKTVIVSYDVRMMQHPQHFHLKFMNLMSIMMDKCRFHVTHVILTDFWCETSMFWVIEILNPVQSYSWRMFPAVCSAQSCSVSYHVCKLNSVL